MREGERHLIGPVKEVQVHVPVVHVLKEARRLTARQERALRNYG